MKKTKKWMLPVGYLLFLGILLGVFVWGLGKTKTAKIYFVDSGDFSYGLTKEYFADSFLALDEQTEYGEIKSAGQAANCAYDAWCAQFGESPMQDYKSCYVYFDEAEGIWYLECAAAQTEQLQPPRIFLRQSDGAVLQIWTSFRNYATIVFE